MSNPSKPVLYSFRRCPYAMRARLALCASGTECELREVVLRDKPEAMLMASSKATVPVLEVTPGTVIDESLSIMLWSLRRCDPEGWMNPDAVSLEQMMALIEEADSDFKSNLDRYKYPNRYEDANAEHYRSQGEKFLSKLDMMLKHSPYLFGSRICLADMAIAPFIRQFANTDRDWFDATPYHALQRWLVEFLESDRFASIMHKYPKWEPGDPATMFPATLPDSPRVA